MMLISPFGFPRGRDFRKGRLRWPDLPMIRSPDSSLLSRTQLSAEFTQVFLVFRGQAAHDFSDASRMGGKDAGDEALAGGRDGGQDEAFVAPLLLPFDQAPLFQIVDHQSEVPAAGQDAACQLAQVERSYMI